MQTASDLPSARPKCPKIFAWFVIAGFDLSELRYLNDPVHLSVKLHRFNMSHASRAGTGIISQGCLIDLVQELGKAVTGLTVHQLTSKVDVMNFGIAEKVASPRIINLLKEPHQAATKFFLELSHCVQVAYIKEDTDVLGRMTKGWQAAFMSRIWRKYVKEGSKKQSQDGTLSLEHDFMSRNSYVCIELNGHCLLEFAIQCRNLGKPELFVPFQTNSQDCESMFRTLRSMATTLNTAVSLKLHEVLHKVRRIQVLEEIKSTVDSEFYKFHEKKCQRVKYIAESIPSDEELNARL